MHRTTFVIIEPYLAPNDPCHRLIYITMALFDNTLQFEQKKIIFKMQYVEQCVSPGVNFNNFLCAGFFYESVIHNFMVLFSLFWHFYDESIFSKKLLVKCWWNWLLWSISSTYYACVFCTKFWLQKVWKPKQSFVIFGAKIFYKKHAHKMMMKSTPAFHENECVNSV